MAQNPITKDLHAMSSASPAGEYAPLWNGTWLPQRKPPAVGQDVILLRVRSAVWRASRPGPFGPAACCAGGGELTVTRI